MTSAREKRSMPTANETTLKQTLIATIFTSAKSTRHIHSDSNLIYSHLSTLTGLEEFDSVVGSSL